MPITGSTKQGLNYAITNYLNFMKFWHMSNFKVLEAYMEAH